MTTEHEDITRLAALTSTFRRAADDVDALLDRLTDADPASPTPCVGWTVADLLAHMIGQNRGFAEALTRGDAPARAFGPVRYTRADWNASKTELARAFEAAAPSDTAVLIELGPAPLSATFVVAAQLLVWTVSQLRLPRALVSSVTMVKLL